MSKFYGREKQFIDEFLKIDDASIYDLVLDKCKPESIAFNIMNELKNRRLFKRCYVRELSQISSPIKRMEIWKKYEGILEKEIADEAGVNTEFVITHKESEVRLEIQNNDLMMACWISNDIPLNHT